VASPQPISTAIKRQIESLNLDVQQVQNHQRELFSEDRPSTYFPIVDTCRIDNGHLIAFEQLKSIAKSASPEKSKLAWGAFIPAAGAATRYFKPITTLMQKLRDGIGVKEECARLQQEFPQIASWPLPPSVQALWRGSDNYLTALVDLSRPKALQLATCDGHTFLGLKNLEHEALSDLLKAQIYIAPLSQATEFTAALSLLRRRQDLQSYVLEQGPALSTIRFLPNGEPWQDSHGNVSVVPAGHGALSLLMPEIKKQFGIESVFIRNIDSVMGTLPEPTDATRHFLNFYASLRSEMVSIRNQLSTGKTPRAADIRGLLTLAKLPVEGEVSLATLGEIQKRLFFAKDVSSAATLSKLYSRPFNILGQVPNTGKDVGGTPCIVNVGGKQVKLCLEVPHASPGDIADFLANNERATHFNPVFAASELTDNPTHYLQQGQPFWLRSEKDYLGNKVFYYETVLYELIGNSEFGNVLFCEVPRSVFAPHKTISDAAGRFSHSWMA
jgi:hypothetical protein